MKELLLIPGPTPVSSEVLKALSQETISHTDDRFVNTFRSALEKTKVFFGASTGFPFIIAGSGTLGMEMSLVNVLRENDSILVLSNGFFGDRFIEIGETIGANVDFLRANPGERVLLDDIEKKLKEKKFDVLTITHVDTSTGVIANVAEIVELVRSISKETIIIVDGVCATGGVAEEFDKWGIDIVFTGSQKALAVPPGLTLLAFSERAMEKRKSLGRIRYYYEDIERWMPVMEDPHRYFATPAVNMIYALNASLTDILSQGLGSYFEKHKKLAKQVRSAMKVLGFDIIARFPAPTLSVFVYPEGIDDLQFRKALYSKGIVVAAALKELNGKCFRMGHMGSLTEDDLLVAIKRIVEVIEEMKGQINKGKVFDAFFNSFE